MQYPLSTSGNFFLIMVAIGYLAFDWLPNTFDFVAQTRATIGLTFFIIAFVAFINIHHCFVDNILWRFKNNDVREFLLD